MADYDIKLNTNQLVDVLSKNDAIKGLLESVLNQVLTSQMTEHLGARSRKSLNNFAGAAFLNQRLASSVWNWMPE